MNFLALKHNLEHMLSDDPQGIENPLDNTKEEGVVLTQPHEDVHISYHQDHMIIHIDNLDPVDVDYRHYSEAEVASAITDLVDKL